MWWSLTLSACHFKRRHFYQEKSIWTTQVQKSWVLGSLQSRRHHLMQACWVCKQSGHLKIFIFSSGWKYCSDLIFGFSWPQGSGIRMLAVWELGLVARTLLKCGSKQNSYPALDYESKILWCYLENKLVMNHCLNSESLTAVTCFYWGVKIRMLPMK